ncbi:MAG TPA: hypothetical protein VF786_14890 [Terriglobales bacterium]
MHHSTEKLAIAERFARAGHVSPQSLAEYTRQPGFCLYPEKMGAAELRCDQRTGCMTAVIPIRLQNGGSRSVTIERVEVAVNGTLFALPGRNRSDHHLEEPLEQGLEMKAHGRELHRLLCVSGWPPPGVGAAATCRITVYFSNGRNAECSMKLPVLYRMPPPLVSRGQRVFAKVDLRQRMAESNSCNGPTRDVGS